MVGYMVLTISTTGLTDVEVYEHLSRCYDLFIKRLRSRFPDKWKTIAKRYEAGETGHFPHLNVVFFGWAFIPKKALHAMWGDVTYQETGTRARALRISGLGYKEAGRLGYYTFKEQLTGLSKYTWKEGRPVWLPKRRRMWSKSPRSLVRSWPQQRRGPSPLAAAARGQTAVEATLDRMMRSALGLETEAAVSSLGDMRGPPTLFA